MFKEQTLKESLKENIWKEKIVRFNKTLYLRIQLLLSNCITFLRQPYRGTC